MTTMVGCSLSLTLGLSSESMIWVNRTNFTRFRHRDLNEVRHRATDAANPHEDGPAKTRLGCIEIATLRDCPGQDMLYEGARI